MVFARKVGELFSGESSLDSDVGYGIDVDRIDSRQNENSIFIHPIN